MAVYFRIKSIWCRERENVWSHSSAHRHIVIHLSKIGINQMNSCMDRRVFSHWNHAIHGIHNCRNPCQTGCIYTAWSVGALEKQLQFRGGLQIALCTCAECAPDLRKTCAFFYARIWELCVGFCWWSLLLAGLVAGGLGCWWFLLLAGLPSIITMIYNYSILC